MDTPRWAELLTRSFPRLACEGFEIVDQPSERYNCIAYAAGDTSKWWDHNENHYWPEHATRDNRIESLKEVFTLLGFEQCHDSRAEHGYQKVALYEKQGVWTHAVAQTPNGRWRSKIGQGSVIEHHSPESLLGGMYGDAMITMRRAVNSGH